jgi:MarR family transcriptional regulator, organic hydroperoxide resistance regulator
MASTTKTASGDVQAFTSGLEEFMRALRTARGRFNRAPATPELSASQFHLLEPLAASDGPMAMCALAEAADVAAPTATRMIDGLVKRGLAERKRPDGGDRRRVEITLTADGRRLVAAKRLHIARAREEVFRRLSPSERASAARLLHSLAAAIDDLHP